MLKWEEKRRFPRLKFNTPIRYQIRGTPEFYNTVSKDVSLGGISLMNERFIVPATPLMLEINVLSRMISPIGRVAWSLPLPHSDRYQLGVEFLELDPQEKEYLADYINLQRASL